MLWYESAAIHDQRFLSFRQTRVELDNSGSPVVMFCVFLPFPADICDRDSFTAVSKWVAKVKAEADSTCVIALVGTKKDLCDTNPKLRQVTAAEGEQEARALDALFCETSSLASTGVAGVFQLLLEQCTSIFLKTAPPIPVPVAAQPDTPLLGTASSSSGFCVCCGGGATSD